MWKEAFKIAAIGFSVVFIVLWILAVSVRVMSYFFRHDEQKEREVKQ